MKILFFLVAFVLPYKVWADFAAYTGRDTLLAESSKYIIIHVHDWAGGAKNANNKRGVGQNIFTPENTLAYLVCVNKLTSKIVFQKPCPALTKIEISKDENFIVGLSNIKLRNPFQMVVFSTRGELLRKMHISTGQAKMTEIQLNDFKKRFPMQQQCILAHDGIIKRGNSYFIDLVDRCLQENFYELYDYLYSYRTSHYLSKNFSESVTNWIHWFNEENPAIQYHFRSGQLQAISLLDPENVRMQIPIIK